MVDFHGAVEPATRREKLSSRATQVAFVVGLLALWYAATNHWGITSCAT